MRRFFAPALLFLVTLIVFHRLAFTDWILARGDTYSYHYPYWQVRNEAILEGQLPLWTPDLFMGVPLMANPQIGTFYPPNWLVAPLSAPDGVRISVLIHVYWTALGAYALARRVLGVGTIGGLIGASLFAFGGHIGAHVEQINQLQGLAWLPWLLYLFDRVINPIPQNNGRDRSRPYAEMIASLILLAMAWALQIFSGHTQTVFISGIALGLYALCTRPIRGVITLAGAGIGAILLAVPQLIPTLELSSLSNRRGGFNVNQATAFSFNPFVTGRALLPSYDRLIFSEYIAYPGIIGMALAWIGALSQSLVANPSLSRLRRVFAMPQTRWIVLALVGLLMAYGLYNPLYLVLAGLPGFNLFRVPARWLALFALGVSMLAALGAEVLVENAKNLTQRRKSAKAQSGSLSSGESGLGHEIASKTRPYWGVKLLFPVVIIALMIAAPLAERTPDLTPTYPPETITWIGWVVALVIATVGIVLLSNKSDFQARLATGNRFSPIRILLGVVLVGSITEIVLASWAMPFNQLVPPDAFSAQRFTISQMLAYNEDEIVPGRILSLSDLQFDPGDRAALERRYDALGITGESRALAFDTVKLREVLAGNQPLLWGIPSIDGFDGGLLPTGYYTAFTSLMLPEGELRTLDGRLREMMYSDACGGACIPDQRWLSMTDTQYLLTDKVYDLVREGVFFDTTFAQTGEVRLSTFSGFEANAIEVIYSCSATPCNAPSLNIWYGVGRDYIEVQPTTTGEPLERYLFARYELDNPTPVMIVLLNMVDLTISSPAPNNTIHAVTLANRTDEGVTFEQLADAFRMLSSDIKLYRVALASHRALLAPTALCVADDEFGTEVALNNLRNNVQESFAFGEVIMERATISIATQDCSVLPVSSTPYYMVSPETVDYQATRVTVEVPPDLEGYLLLKDAYYPGWVATVDGLPTTVYRANVMFRAVWVPEGAHTVVFEYKPAWMPGIFIAGGALWLLGIAGVGLTLWITKRRAS